MEDNMEELASSGGPPVSHASQAQWNDANNACLLELCIKQRRAGTYNGSQMSGEGHQAVVDGLLARRRKKSYLKKVLTSPPANEDLLDELFRGYTMDGTTTFVPSDDYGDNEGQDARTEDDEEEEFAQTPTSRKRPGGARRGKRALIGTTSTLTIQ
ncbi:unnamed protein product [Miscanthus lutarioriparius]|uniref:Uncharacterized protein n=1 Tax=Miscanthus lutarioriparius TaxID=422564 RepID=A0A811RUU8_9POAL|nr:unnamed protein product [Miscanthus lutarioriparius]